MDKKLNMKLFIVLLIIGIVALIVVTMLLISNLNKKPETNPELSFGRSRNDSQPKLPKETEDYMTLNFAKNHKGKKDVPDLSKVDFSKYAKIQFAKPTSKDDIVKIKYREVPGVITIKLFKELAPNTVNDYENAIKNNDLVGTSVISVTTSDLIHQSIKKNGEGIFRTANESDLNFALVPYKGALVKNLTSDPKDTAKSEYKILMNGMEEFNSKIIKNLNLPSSLTQEINEHGGRLFGHYLTQVVFGQVVDGFDVIDKAQKKLVEMFHDARIPIQEKKLTIESVTLQEGVK